METREIKFRAWHTEANKMLFVGDDSGTTHPLDCVVYAKNQPVILMQYTGLKDKNGVEIYEGDVVKDSELTYIVRFGHCFIIEGTFHGWYLEHLERMDYNGPFSDGDTKVLSVLGNIYEHPHLLNL